jgi:hypothetical protein
MTYVITNQKFWVGVADHLDEAMDFAIRISKAVRVDVSWTEAGAMHSKGSPTGWRVGVMKGER